METLTQIKTTNLIDVNSVMAFVVLENKCVFDEYAFFNKKFLNASLKEISIRLVDKYRYSIININENDYNEVFTQIAKKINASIKTIVVIFADACLLENSVIDMAINRCFLSKVVNLNKSFVCDVEFFQSANLDKITKEHIFEPALTNKIIDKSIFVSDLEFNFQNIVIKNLIKKQVKFLSLSDAKIDFTVNIGANTIVKNGVILMGETDIGENCYLENVTIKDSYLLNNVKAENLVITNSVIKSGKSISGLKNKKQQQINGAIVD